MTSTTSKPWLAENLRGELIGPGDAGYDDARRVWNGMIDRRPALIAMCEGTADVIACIDYARETEMPITVRGGGHSVAGKAIADDALLIDLSQMNSVQVDAHAKTARAGAGATWGTVDHETQAFGLAVTGGVDSRTGIGGLTLGGGIGYLARPFGLTIDHLIGAEVVLSDGRIVNAADPEKADLLWALKGGGGNCGVVTSFEYRLNEVGPEVMHVQLFLPMEQAEEGLTFYREFMASSSEMVSCFALFINTPPVEPFPEDSHGTTCLALVAMHAGALEEGEGELKPLAEFGDPMLSVLAPIPYAALQSSFDAGAPDGGRYYWKAQYLKGLSDDFIETLVSDVDPLPGVFSNVFIEPLGGAVTRVDATATAFPHRNVDFGVGISSGWVSADDDEASIAWTRDLHEKLTPFGTGGVYINYVDRDEDRTKDAYGQNARRLDQIAAKYDPEGMFSG